MNNIVKWRHVLCGFGAIGLLLTATACGPAVKTEEDEYSQALREVRAIYDGYFKTQPPDYVVVTTPESSSSLDKHAKRVLETIESVLTDRKIPHECRPLDDVLTTFTSRIRKREYLAYELPASMTEKDGGTVLYINLCMDRDLETKRHPLAVDRKIRMRVWNDPNTKVSEF